MGAVPVMEERRKDYTNIGERLAVLETEVKNIQLHFSNHVSSHKKMYGGILLILLAVVSLWIKT